MLSDNWISLDIIYTHISVITGYHSDSTILVPTSLPASAHEAEEFEPLSLKLELKMQLALGWTLAEEISKPGCVLLSTPCEPWEICSGRFS